MKNNGDQFDRHKNSDAFKTPDNYFEEFPSKIEAFISKEIDQTSWKEKFSQLFVTRFFVTTSIALLLAIGTFTIQQLTVDSKINHDEVYSYLKDLEASEIDLELMSEYAIVYPKIRYEPTEQQIINYLSEQEIEEIINQ